MKQWFFWLSLFSCSLALADPIDTNSVRVGNSPAWLKASRIQRTVERMEAKLEWDIRKIRMQWHADPHEFSKQHGLNDPTVLAYTWPVDQSVHMGPRITEANFDAVFAHELTHVILA